MPDASLRTALFGAITLGVIIGRHLLALDGLSDAPPEQVVEVLRPCIEALTKDSDVQESARHTNRVERGG